MKYFSKTILYLTIALLLLWQLPWCYNFFFYKPSSSMFTLYSCVVEDFVTIDFGGEEFVRSSLSGATFTEAEFDSILPMFYSRQLVTDGRFPETIQGYEVDYKASQQHNFHYRISPEAINRPVIGLYHLLESMSKRVDLEMPDDVFRLTDTRIEFVDMETNTIKEEKSIKFTEALTKKGFEFPAKKISGNPTTRKEYDEGYVILDANNNLYHLKMTVGRPYVRNVVIPEGITLEHLYLTEFKNRRNLAFLVDTENQLYVLGADYKIYKIGVPSFEPEIEYLTIIGNMFDWTVRISSDTRNHYYAIDNNDYSLIQAYEIEVEPNGKIKGLTFTSPLDKFVKPRF